MPRLTENWPTDTLSALVPDSMKPQTLKQRGEGTTT